MEIIIVCSSFASTKYCILTKMVSCLSNLLKHSILKPINVSLFTKHNNRLVYFMNIYCLPTIKPNLSLPIFPFSSPINESLFNNFFDFLARISKGYEHKFSQVQFRFHFQFHFNSMASASVSVPAFSYPDPHSHSYSQMEWTARQRATRNNKRH